MEGALHKVELTGVLLQEKQEGKHKNRENTDKSHNKTTLKASLAKGKLSGRLADPESHL